MTQCQPILHATHSLIQSQVCSTCLLVQQTLAYLWSHYSMAARLKLQHWQLPVNHIRLTADSLNISTANNCSDRHCVLKCNTQYFCAQVHTTTGTQYCVHVIGSASQGSVDKQPLLTARQLRFMPWTLLATPPTFYNHYVLQPLCAVKGEHHFPKCGVMVNLLIIHTLCYGNTKLCRAKQAVTLTGTIHHALCCQQLRPVSLAKQRPSPATTSVQTDKTGRGGGHSWHVLRIQQRPNRKSST